MKSIIHVGIVACLCVFCGCQPPGNPDPNNPGSGNPDSGTPGVGIAGTPVSVEQRTAVMKAIPQTLADMSAEDPKAAREAVLAMLLANNAIEAAGIGGDGGIWGRFTDNQLLLVAMNDPVPEVEESNTKAIIANRTRRSVPPKPAHSPLPTRNSKRDVGANNEDADVSMPQSSDCFLFNGYNNDLASVNDHLFNISFWLTGHGYVEQTYATELATIENLMTVKNAGVLYVQGHGTIGFIRQSDDPNTGLVPAFGMGTLTPRPEDGSTDETYKELLKTQQIGFLVTPNVFRSSLDQVLRYKPVAASGYFITKNFVLEQWTFKPGAWVYIDVCDGFDQLFADACIEKGAGVYLGWDVSPRHIDSLETSEYLFSRVLGINDLANAKYVTAESPPQRAFALQEILDDMATRPRKNKPFAMFISDHLNESTDINNVAEILTNGGKATLSAKFAQNVTEPILIPTIEHLDIADQPTVVYDEPNILTLSGSFGVEELHVTVGGSEAEIILRSSQAVICRIGPNDFGDVVVQVGEHISRPRKLTQWHGLASSILTRDDGPPTEHLVLDVTFRGDIQSYRTKPGETPIFLGLPSFEAIPDISKVTTAAVTGNAPCDEGQTGSGYTWSTPGPLNFPVMKPGSTDDPHMWFQGGGDGITLSETGVIEGTVAFGAHAIDGVRQTGDCTPLSPFDRRLPLDLSGGTKVKISPGNYDIDEIQDDNIAGLKLFSSVFCTASATPSNDDPR